MAAAVAYSKISGRYSRSGQPDFEIQQGTIFLSHLWLIKKHTTASARVDSCRFPSSIGGDRNCCCCRCYYCSFSASLSCPCSTNWAGVACSGVGVTNEIAPGGDPRSRRPYAATFCVSECFRIFENRVPANTADSRSMAVLRIRSICRVVESYEMTLQAR